LQTGPSASLLPVDTWRTVPFEPAHILQDRSGRSDMALLRWALVFFVVALVAALFGFGNIAEGAAEIAKVLFFIFVAICVILVVLGLTVYRSVTGP
jgi:uncharacterized membrane protein YtjA (UPF0391 family)